MKLKFIILQNLAKMFGVSERGGADAKASVLACRPWQFSVSACSLSHEAEPLPFLI